MKLVSNAQLDKMFQDMGCELWPGVSFYLTDPKERAKAVEWLRELLNEVDRTPNPHNNLKWADLRG